MACCDRGRKTKEEMRVAHGAPQEFWEALLDAQGDGFITMKEARAAQVTYEVIYEAAPETL
jgi:hypothetical protein